jgi:hypothetical protein
MFLEGMSKPWWIAAIAVWLVVLIGLQEYADMDFQGAARLGVLAGGLAAIVVWLVVGRGRTAPPSTVDAPRRSKPRKKA